MRKTISRRGFLKGSTSAIVGAAGLAAGAGAGSQVSHGAAPTALITRHADIPAAKGTRAVVVGGGWGGLTMAKYLKKEAPDWDVVLIESHATFMSCPVSNLWLAGLIDLEFISHSYLTAAKNNNYIYFNATVIDVDRSERVVYTSGGQLTYDYLILAPGIDYDWPAVGMLDPEEIHLLHTHYPAAFKPGSEHLTLKRKIDEFEKGLFVLTVPSGNYRCLPGPYERACMIASVFKRKKLKAKVLLLDFNPKVKIKAEGFMAAFQELYKDYLEYVPSVTVHRVDVLNKTVIGEFDDYQFDDASIYPRVRGALLIETLGLVAESSPQKEARINLFRNHLHDDLRVYVIGDSRPMGYSKSGSTANDEAKYVAKVIVGLDKGKKLEWKGPYTSCYSMVNADPPEAIYFGSQYLPPLIAHTPMDMERTVKAWIERGSAFAWRDQNMNRSPEMGQAMYAWAYGYYKDLFG